MSEITIREATEDDVPMLVEFLVDLGLHVSGGKRRTLSKKAKKRLQAFLRDYLYDREKYLVVACDPANKPVAMGNIQIWHNPNLWEEAEAPDQKSGFIDDLWVEPEYRKQGIMARMLDALIEFAEGHDIEELILEYAISNDEAAAVWERLGFTPTGVRATANTATVRQNLSIDN
ncbi:MAG TPA: GNAT family N-acetyltransferase [Gammaproteobacteria bacterium]|nr:GNAT family N-acetyltransferase [Gammaproteobacteria bacterium]